MVTRLVSGSGAATSQTEQFTRSQRLAQRSRAIVLDSDRYAAYRFQEHAAGKELEGIDCVAQGQPREGNTRNRRRWKSSTYRRDLFPERNSHSLSVRALSRCRARNAGYVGRAA